MALRDNLVGWWELGEASGTRADSHTTGYTLSDNGTVTQGAGRVGNAAQFTAANVEWLSRADNADLSSGDTDWTQCSWFNRDSEALYLPFAKSDNSTQQEWQFMFWDVFQFTAYATLTGTGPVTVEEPALPFLDGIWYFVVWWHDAAGNTINLQVNNGTVRSSAFTGGMGDGTADFTVGARQGGANPYNGRLDQVARWRRVVTADERTWLYNNGSGRAYLDSAPVPIAWTTA